MAAPRLWRRWAGAATLPKIWVTIVTEIESSPCVLCTSVVGESGWACLGYLDNTHYCFCHGCYGIAAPNHNLLAFNKLLGLTEKSLTQNQSASEAAEAFFIGTKKWPSLDTSDFTIDSANSKGHSSHMSSKDVLKKAQKSLIDGNMAASLLYILEMARFSGPLGNMKESEGAAIICEQVTA